MPAENLSSGIAVVIDDELDDDKANINNLVSQIEKQNMPCLKYKELPEESVIDHFEGISFLLLDWKLQADLLGEAVPEGVRLPDELRKAAVKENISFLKNHRMKKNLMKMELYRLHQKKMAQVVQFKTALMLFVVLTKFQIFSAKQNLIHLFHMHSIKQ